jgi:hypothetical protein
MKSVVGIIALFIMLSSLCDGSKECKVVGEIFDRFL